MLYSGTDPESYITEYTLVYEEKKIVQTSRLYTHARIRAFGLSYVGGRRLVTTLLPYRGTSLIRNRPPLGPYSRTMPRALGGP